MFRKLIYGDCTAEDLSKVRKTDPWLWQLNDLFSIPVDFSTAKERLAQLIKSKTPRLIFSDEYLGLIDDPLHISRLKFLCDEQSTAIDTLRYIRSAEPWLRSLFQELILDSPHFFIAFPEHTRGAKDAKMLEYLYPNYQPSCAAWDQVFGEDANKLCPFYESTGTERFDVVADFSRKLDLPIASAVPRTNSGGSAEKTALGYALIFDMFAENCFEANQYKSLMGLGGKYGYRTFGISQSVTAHLKDQNQADLDWIEDRCGFSPSTNPRRADLEISTLADLLDYGQNEIDAFGATLAQNWGQRFPVTGSFHQRLVQFRANLIGSDRRLKCPPSSFDPSKYLFENPDVAAAGVDPTGHYLRHGFFEGRTT